MTFPKSCDKFPFMINAVSSDGTPPPALAALAELLAPLCELAVLEGVKLPALVDLLKLGLVQAAVDNAVRHSASPPSDSRLSVMTGVHRKDLRDLRAGTGAPPIRHKSLASEVFARWMSDPAYLTRKGQPRVLPRQSSVAEQPSFERLVSDVSSDVHPRAVLDELLRLGIVRCGPLRETNGQAPRPPSPDDHVRIVATAFTPSNDRTEQLRFLAANAADHLRAGNRNLEEAGQAFLEQAIFSDRLSADSAEQFNRMTLQAWEQSFSRLMPALRELFAADQSKGVPMTRRVRFGMYSFVGDIEVATDDTPRAADGHSNE